jgi:adenylosuccinate lyase
MLADPLRFTGAATAQVAAVAARVDEIVAAHPQAAAYTPGAIL